MGASTSVANFAASSRIASTRSGVASSLPGKAAIAASPASSFIANSMSRVGATYVVISVSFATGLPASGQQTGDFRYCLKQISHQTVIRHLEDRCVRVLVDGHDHLRILHAG